MPRQISIRELAAACDRYARAKARQEKAERAYVAVSGLPSSADILIAKQQLEDRRVTADHEAHRTAKMLIRWLMATSPFRASSSKAEGG